MGGKRGPEQRDHAGERAQGESLCGEPAPKWGRPMAEASVFISHSSSDSGASSRQAKPGRKPAGQ
jgi:hypothetical protein